MRILITGGAGFIGSHVQDAYLEAGHDVTILDNLSSGKAAHVRKDVRFYQADLRDRDSVMDIFREAKFDAVNHHAAQMDVRASVANPFADAEINILGSLNLLDAAVATGVQSFIFASTGGAIYGEQDLFPADENHPLRPRSPYGVAKLAVEKYLHVYSEVHGLSARILRYANIYGPRQNALGEAGVVAIFCRRLLAGEAPVVNGDGNQTRDFVFVSDVVRANRAALEHSGQFVVNIGTGIETDVNGICRLLRGATSNGIREVHGPPKKGEQLRSSLNSAAALRIIGWKAEVPLEEGLRRTYEDFASESIS